MLTEDLQTVEERTEKWEDKKEQCGKHNEESENMILGRKSVE